MYTEHNWGPGMYQSSMSRMTAFDLSNLQILVVEDNKNTQFLVREVLRLLRVPAIQMVEDGEAAQQVLESFAPDIIITDWAMGPMNGLEFTTWLRRDENLPNPFVPVIMLTAHTGYAHVMEAINHGVNEFLAKPISVSSLYQRLVTVIERPRLFVRAGEYVGPDRRRRGNDPSSDGPKRRESDHPPADKAEARAAET